MPPHLVELGNFLQAVSYAIVQCNLLLHCRSVSGDDLPDTLRRTIHSLLGLLRTVESELQWQSGNLQLRLGHRRVQHCTTQQLQLPRILHHKCLGQSLQDLTPLLLGFHSHHLAADCLDNAAEIHFQLVPRPRFPDLHLRQPIQGVLLTLGLGCKLVNTLLPLLQLLCRPFFFLLQAVHRENQLICFTLLGAELQLLPLASFLCKLRHLRLLVDGIFPLLERLIPQSLHPLALVSKTVAVGAQGHDSVL
mmetsp:Transcript_27986/g.67236  ORF Transcript_27986/g.67236 Transcript_27986/m.67236 type:complete len:249 (-) Transcript_27986:162-908(-)